MTTEQQGVEAKSRNCIPTTIRLPADLKRELAALADRQRRSINAQVEILLREGVDAANTSQSE